MLFPETNNWRRNMQDVAAAIDETMGELVTVIPAVASRPNYPTTEDASRAITATAVFTNKARDVIMGEHVGRMSTGHSISPIVSTSEPVFSFSYGALPWPILQGYRIRRECDQALYEVTDVKPDGVSRIIVHVVQLGRQREAQ